jgi:hypothetical protein
MAATVIWMSLSYARADIFAPGHNSVSGSVKADIVDISGGVHHPPNSPGSVPAQNKDLSDTGVLYASDSDSADASAFLPAGWSIHPSGTNVEGTAHAHGGVFLTSGTYVLEDEHDPNPGNTAFLIFNAYGNASGNIVSGGVSYVTAAGTYSMMGNTSVDRIIGSDAYRVAALVTPTVTVNVNSQHLGTGVPAVLSAPTAAFRFSFGAYAGEWRLGGSGTPTQIGTSPTAGAALVIMDQGATGGAALGAALSPEDLAAFPGSSSSLPLPYFRTSDQASGTADAYRLVVPVVEGYGTANPVFAKFDNTSELTGQAAIGYTFRVENDGQAFKGFSLPAALPGGQSELQLSFSDVIVNLLAGEEVDFTQFVPGGVRKFSLLGINLDEGFDASVPPEFVHSFRFIGDGTTIVSASGITVPEPTGDYNGNGIVDAADYVEWRNDAGTPEAYYTWRAQFGETVAGSSLHTPAPEPATWLLLMNTAAALLNRSRYRSLAGHRRYPRMPNNSP